MNAISRRHFARHVLATFATTALGPLASLACAGSRRAESPAVPHVADCEGRAYLEVTNTLSESIDVYVADVYNAHNARIFLGTARPGTTQLPIENWQRTYPAFALPDGMPAGRRAVRYAYRCERA